MCHFFLQQANGEGTIIGVGSGAAGSLFPNMSSYISSKLAQMKFMEILHIGKTYLKLVSIISLVDLTIRKIYVHDVYILEHPTVRVFTLLPGLLRTAMTAEDYLPFARDDPMLTGGMSLFLCTPRAEWLRGGIMSVNCKPC